MLQFIRENTKGFIAWVIVIILAVPFALFGVNQYFTGGQEAWVAKVGDREIYFDEVQQAYRQQYQRMQQIFQGNMPDLDQDRMRRQVLEDLITRALLAQAREEHGYRVGTDALIEEVRQIPQFQVQGEFSMDAYEGYLASRGMSKAGFERDVMQGLAMQQIRDGIVSSAFATHADLERIVALREQQRKAADIRIPVARFTDRVEVDDEAVRSYYEDNKDAFMTTETVDLAYLELRAEDLASDEPVSEERLRTYYEEQQAKFLEQERRNVSHILVTPETDSASGREKAREKAAQLAERIRAGADFAELAKEHSDDPGSADEGGDLGWITRGMMTEGFEEAVFGMKVGEVAGPVETDFGFHVIRLGEIDKPEARPFEEVREEVRAELRQERAQDRFYEAGQRLVDLTYANPETLEVAADELGLQIRRVEGVTRTSGEGIAGNPKVRDQAFGESVLEKGNNSDVVELGPDRVVVFRVAEHHPPEAKPLDAVRDQVEQRVRERLALEQAGELADRVAERLRGGDAPATVAAEFDLEFNPARFMARDSNAVGAELTLAVFEADKPPAGEVSVGRVELDDGFAVFALSEVKPGRLDDLEPDEVEQRRRQIVRQRGSEEFDAYVAELRRKANVRIREENLNNR